MGEKIYWNKVADFLENEPNKQKRTTEAVAQYCKVSKSTARRYCKRWVEEGLLAEKELGFGHWHKPSYEVRH